MRPNIMRNVVAIAYVLVLATLFAAGDQPKKKPVKKPKAAGTTVVLNWTPSGTTGSNAATSQKVCRATSAGAACGTPLTTIQNNTTATYTDSTGVAGTMYYYTIQACNSTGCSTPSNEVSIAFPTPPAVPAAPTNLTATVQ